MVRLILLVLCSSVLAIAATDSGLTLLLRPQIGFGISLGGDSATRGVTYHYGGRAMFGIGSESRAGVEFIQLGVTDIVTSKRTQGLGAILEQRIAKKYTLGIGVLQYDPIGSDTQKRYGVVSSVGWEPYSKGRIEPFVSGRAEVIFRDTGNMIVFSFFGGVTLYVL